MSELLVPVALRWAVPDAIAELIEDEGHPYRLRLLTMGSVAVCVEMQVLPVGTIPYTPLVRCTCCPEHGPVVRPAA
jgi:hypothetical protein